MTLEGGKRSRRRQGQVLRESMQRTRGESHKIKNRRTREHGRTSKHGHKQKRSSYFGNDENRNRRDNDMNYNNNNSPPAKGNSSPGSSSVPAPSAQTRMSRLPAPTAETRRKNEEYLKQKTEKRQKVEKVKKVNKNEPLVLNESKSWSVNNNNEMNFNEKTGVIFSGKAMEILGKLKNLNENTNKKALKNEIQNLIREYKNVSQRNNYERTSFNNDFNKKIREISNVLGNINVELNNSVKK